MAVSFTVHTSYCTLLCLVHYSVPATIMTSGKFFCAESISGDKTEQLQKLFSAVLRNIKVCQNKYKKHLQAMINAILCGSRVVELILKQFWPALSFITFVLSDSISHIDHMCQCVFLFNLVIPIATALIACCCPDLL